MKKPLIAAVLLVLSIGVAPSLAGDARTSATAPSNNAAPTIAGSAQEGKTLTASSGSWSGTTPITFTYQWQRCDSSGGSCVNISRQTVQTYTVTSDDVSHTLVVVVSAHNAAGTASKPSAATAVVAGATPPSNTAAPSVSGSASVGSTLTAVKGTWSGTTPITYTYAWQRCNSSGSACAAISGATAATYVVTNTDVGHPLRVGVTATNPGGTAQATSAATDSVVAGVPVDTVAPALSGTAKEGQTLTSTAGTWTGSAPITFALQWWRCDATGANCSTIPGATSASYVLTVADVGHALKMRVSATNSAGTVAATSTLTAAVASATGTTTTTTTAPPPSGTTKLPNGETSIAASNVPDTDRLTVSSVKATPSTITGRAPVTVTFKIADANKYDVAGALVYVLALPYSWGKASVEAATAANGTVSITVTPTRAAPKKGALVLFVRARTPQGSLLAGSSTRRLVQVKIRP
jgi:hypothetical protein